MNKNAVYLFYLVFFNILMMGFSIYAFFSTEEYHYSVKNATEEKLRGIKSRAAAINTRIGNLVKTKQFS